MKEKVKEKPEETELTEFIILKMNRIRFVKEPE